MAEHIKFEMDLQPVEDGLPTDAKVYWIRRKDRGCLRQASYVDTKGYKAGWYPFPSGAPFTDVTHYGRPPQMGPTPCEEQREVVARSERHN